MFLKGTSLLDKDLSNRLLSTMSGAAYCYELSLTAIRGSIMLDTHRIQKLLTYIQKKHTSMHCNHYTNNKVQKVPLLWYIGIGPVASDISGLI